MNSSDQDPYPEYHPQTPDTTPPPPPRRVVLRPLASTPWVTYTLIALSILVFIAQQVTQSLLGYDLPAALGMKVNQLIIAGQFWRLVTPILLHASILHIGFNMYALYVIGRGLEQQYGHLRYFLLYLVSGIAGNVFSFLLSSAPSLGASTSIFGLLSAEAIFVYHNRELFGGSARTMLTNIVTIMVINLVLGLSPGIDNWGHLGGLIGGLAFGWFAGPLLEVHPANFGYQLQNRRSLTSAWLVSVVELIVLTGLVYQRIFLP
jgi:rhomboid protease GluP